MLTHEKEDAIYNALLVGMSLEDAYVYAGLTAEEISEVTVDDAYQAHWHQLTKSFEFGLLAQMNEIARKQARIGKETATTWMLERMFPRYSGKPAALGGQVHLHIDNTDPAALDTVEVFNPNAGK